MLAGPQIHESRRHMPKHDKHNDVDQNESREATLEQQANLSNIHARLNAVITKRRNAVREIDNKYKGYHPVDSDGRSSRNVDMRDRKRKQEQIAHFESFYDSPYFGHIDVLDEEGEPHKVLIGEEALAISSDQLVVDWRTEMGDAFYNTQNLTPEICVSNNERYIVYTRAFDNLFITTVPHLSNVKNVLVAAETHAYEQDGVDMMRK